MHGEKHLKGRANDAVAAACLYIACRQEEVPRSFKEICAVSRHPKKEIGRCFKLITRATNIDYGTVTTSDFMVCGPISSRAYNWASVSEPHTSVFNGEFVCAYGVRAYVRTYALPHIVSRFNITFQIVSVIFQIVHVATVAAVQLA